MRHSGMVLVLAIALAGSAAYAAPTQTGKSTTARQLYICDGSAETKRALMRLHGSAEYVSAEEAVAAQAADETWTSPRCITEAEFKRLQSMKTRLVRASIR